MTALARPGSPARTDEPAGHQVVALAVFAGATLLAAGVGSVVTSGTVDSAWFDALDTPSFYPPGSAFGIVWSVLYVMIATSGFRAWRADAPPTALALWGVQMALNLGWVAFATALTIAIAAA